VKGINPAQFIARNNIKLHRPFIAARYGPDIVTAIAIISFIGEIASST
jgi:hypothetical protein